MFIEDKIIYKMVEFWYNMNEQRNGGVAFLSTKPKNRGAIFYRPSVFKQEYMARGSRVEAFCESKTVCED